MESRSITAIVQALNKATVRYLVVGGLAVVAHGYLRLTADLDLILDLDTDNLYRALNALADLNYRARAPVDMRQFADANMRKEWIRDKGMTVFSLFSPDHQATEIDLFADNPLDFAKAFTAAVKLEVSPGVIATVASLDDLILLKRQAGRPRDLEDISQLETIRKETHPWKK